MKKLVNDFQPLGGKHCITCALRQIFTFYGYPISEAMLFGLASGLSFVYINQAVSPMISGRSKVFEFEKKLAQRLHIDICCKKGNDYDKIAIATHKLLYNDQPVLIYVDMPYLSYLNLDENNHFGGHAVILYGYDSTTQTYWISDRDHHDFPIRTPKGDINEDYHLVTYDELKKARSSIHRPFPARNKYLTFNFEGYTGIQASALVDAIEETCSSMLHAPAKLLGLNGIKKFSKEILKWKNFSQDKLKIAGITNYFQISKDGGTGGGIFRKLYGEFLIESALLLDNVSLTTIGNNFINVSKQWDEVASMLWDLSLQTDEGLLTNISNTLLQIYDKEETLYKELMKEIEFIKKT